VYNYPKMLNITNHQNAKQNHNEISPHPSKNDFSKTQKITSVGMDVEKRESLYSIGENVNWYSHYGKPYGSSLKKLKI
jgi:hypothetical protein